MIYPNSAGIERGFCWCEKEIWCSLSGVRFQFVLGCLQRETCEMATIIVDGDLRDALFDVEMRFQVSLIEGLVQVLIRSAGPLVINGAICEPECDVIVQFVSVSGGVLLLRLESTCKGIAALDACEELSAMSDDESNACTSECDSRETASSVMDDEEEVTDAEDESPEQMQQTSVTFSAMMRFFQKNNDHFSWMTAEIAIHKLFGFLSDW